nr:immunoglobulin light chain junction region [Macaca mulatta]
DYYCQVYDNSVVLF